MGLLRFTHTTQYFPLVRKRNALALQIANLIFCGKRLLKIEHTLFIITQSTIEQAKLTKNLPFVTTGYYTKWRHHGGIKLNQYVPCPPTHHIFV